MEVPLPAHAAPVAVATIFVPSPQQTPTQSPPQPSSRTASFRPMPVPGVPVPPGSIGVGDPAIGNSILREAMSRDPTSGPRPPLSPRGRTTLPGPPGGFPNPSVLGDGAAEGTVLQSLGSPRMSPAWTVSQYDPAIPRSPLSAQQLGSNSPGAGGYPGLGGTGRRTKGVLGDPKIVVDASGQITERTEITVGPRVRRKRSAAGGNGSAPPGAGIAPPVSTGAVKKPAKKEAKKGAGPKRVTNPNNPRCERCGGASRVIGCSGTAYAGQQYKYQCKDCKYAWKQLRPGAIKRTKLPQKTSPLLKASKHPGGMNGASPTWIVQPQPAATGPSFAVASPGSPPLLPAPMVSPILQPNTRLNVPIQHGSPPFTGIPHPLTAVVAEGHVMSTGAATVHVGALGATNSML